MKKFLTLVFALIISASLTRAQQGNILVGATSNIGDQPIIFWGLTPTVGYFITDNLCVGLGLNSSSSSSEPQQNYNVESDSLTLSPYVRYYMNDNPMFFHAGISMGSSKNIDDDTDFNFKNEVTSSTFGMNIGVGYSLNWGKHFVFEPMLGLSTTSGSTTIKTTNNNVVTEQDTDAPSNTNIGISLGISFIFGNN